MTDDDREKFKLYQEVALQDMQVKITVLDHYHRLPVVKLWHPEQKAAEVRKWIDFPTPGTAMRVEWLCGTCSDIHSGVMAMLYPYDQALKKFTITGLELEGGLVALGYKQLSDMVLDKTATAFFITRDGQLKTLADRLKSHIFGAYPMSEDMKVKLMMAGITPQEVGKEDWE